MIAKHVPMRNANKSRFRRLIQYLNSPQNKQERVGCVTVTNCYQDNALDACLEIQAVQNINKRTQQDKTYHLILSFREGENVPSDTLTAIESHVCEALGYQDHQRVSVVHHDTDNLHLHVAINKIHPTHYTTHTPYRDYKTLARCCEQMEQTYGLEIDNHIAHKTKSQNQVDDMEHHTGVESLLSWIKRQCAPQMMAAQSWTILHHVMHQHGLRLQERGNGLMITYGTSLSVKASSVARSLSKGHLEKKLGLFEADQAPLPSSKTTKAWQAQAPFVKKAGSTPPPQSKTRLRSLSTLQVLSINSGKQYEAQPILKETMASTNLYKQYKMEQQNLRLRRIKTMRQAQGQRQQLIQAVFQKAQLKRRAIKLLKGSGVSRKLLYALVYQSMKKEIANINNSDHIASQWPHQQVWADWLQTKAKQGDEEALTALRACKEVSLQKKETINRFPQHQPRFMPGLKLDNVTKKGTIIYRVGSTAIRDDGNVFSVTRGAIDTGLAVALRMAVYRYGSHLTVNGSDLFKRRIVEMASTLRLDLTFDHISQPFVKKEQHHEQHRTSQPFASRGRRRDHGRDGIAATIVPARRSQRNRRRGQDLIRPSQSNPRSLGYQPPTRPQNRLRNLSELDVVQLASRGQMLLSRDVSGDVEYTKSQCDHKLRWNLHRSRMIGSSSQATKPQKGKTKRRGKSR